MTTERNIKRTDSAALHSFARGFGQALTTAAGEHWDYDRDASNPDHYVAYMTRKSDGLSISVSVHWRTPGRFSFSSGDLWKDAEGDRVDPYPHGEMRPEISAAQTKKDAVLAKDVLRRLVPHCEIHHAKALEIVAQRNEHADSVNTIADMFDAGPRNRNRMNGRMANPTRTYNVPEKHEGKDGYPRVELAIFDGHVDLSLNSISPAAAKRVLKALGIDPKGA